MMAILVGWIINAIALYVTVLLVPGIEVDNVATIFLSALVIGFVNILIKPAVHLISLPITILTFGIFALIINAVLLGLSAWLVPGFNIAGFLPALLGAIVISIVSTVLNSLLKTKPQIHPLNFSEEKGTPIIKMK